ncbi:putative Zn(2)-C6 fungal-type domain-containing protein [Seiridium unicorne]|uniref:Zn(2)-C6 fungal-type domain-containing protein n=1 Tax=Seiridium unicorne TaxID=138068 RepID=A0ABR2VD80_9PEZI
MYAKPPAKCTSLAAALGLISIDVFSPRIADCSAHFELARRIICMYEVEQPWRCNAIVSMLYQMFRCYETVGNTTKLPLTSFSPPTQQQDPGSDGEHALPINENVDSQHDTGEEFEHYVADTRHFILNSSFGVSSRKMSLLQQTTKLGSSCMDTNHRSPTFGTQVRNLHSTFHAFEDDPTQFLSPVSTERSIACFATGVFTPVWNESTRSGMLPKLISDELVENHQWAFHYAAIVYFHRVIPTSHWPGPSDHATDGHNWDFPAEESTRASGLENCNEGDANVHHAYVEPLKKKEKNEGNERFAKQTIAITVTLAIHLIF